MWNGLIFSKNCHQLSCSAGKESACNAGDPGSISGSGSSPGERIGYSPQYSWAFLVTQTVKNLPAIWDTWVQSLGQEDPLEKEMATYSSILAWRIPIDTGVWWATVHQVAESDATEWLSTAHSPLQNCCCCRGRHLPPDIVWLCNCGHLWLLEQSQVGPLFQSINFIFIPK